MTNKRSRGAETSGVDLIEEGNPPDPPTPRGPTVANTSGSPTPFAPARAPLPEIPMESAPAWQAPRGGPRRPGAGSSPTFSSLEELYSFVPELHEGKGKLRVERSEPKWVPDPDGPGKIQVSGFLGYLEDLPDMEEFAKRFGGFKYRIVALADTPDPDNRGGPPKLSAKGAAEFEIPLAPNLACLPAAGPQPEEVFDMSNPYKMFNQQGRPTFIQQPAQVVDQSGHIIDAVKVGASMGGGGHSGMPAEAWTVFGEQANAAVRSTKELSEQQMHLLTNQLEQERQEAAELRRELRDAQSRPSQQRDALEGLAGVLSALKGSASSEEIQIVRAEFERQREHAERMYRNQTEQLEAKVEAERRLSDERLRDSKDSFAQQERALREEMERRVRYAEEQADRRERDARRDGEREVASLKESNEARLSMLKEQFEARIRELEASHDRERRLGEAMQDTKVMQKDSQYIGQVKSLEDQLHRAEKAFDDQLRRAEMERDRAQEEAAKLREQYEKPFPEKIRETQELAEMISPRVEAESEESLVGVLKEAVQMAPPFLAAFLNRGGGQGEAVVPPAPNQPQQLPSHQEQEEEPEPEPEPPQGMEDMHGFPAEYHPPRGEPVRSNIARAPEPPKDPWGPFAWTGQPPQALAQIFNVVLGGMDSGASPQAVAEALGGMFSPAVVQQLPATVPIDRVIQSVRDASATSKTKLVHPDGRKFMREVWAAMATLGKQEAAPAPQPAKPQEPAKPKPGGGQKRKAAK